MYKTFGQRISVLGLLALLFVGVYGIARYYAPVIVAYVVKQALIQKSPEGMNPSLVQERFEALLASTPPEAKLVKLVTLSSYLEKTQKLTPAELDRLLATVGTTPVTGF
ncbi:MAG: hypothetical protein LAP85_18710 [Acidobacteriia bacterium]|nr:hypothetical protein [Terriglobia bacterium]